MATKKKLHLKIRLAREGKKLFMQVLSQTRRDFDWDNGEGFHITSCLCPEITTSVLYVRGEEKDKDKQIASFICRSVEAAEKLYNKIVNAVEMYNEGGGLDDVEAYNWEEIG